MALRRVARRAALLCALTAALPAPAAANHGTPFLDDTLATYMAIGHAYWGGPMPTCVESGGTVIPAHAVLYDDPDPTVAARADQPGCRIWLDRSSWREMLPAEACMVVVHEWGHLLGQGHSLNPFDLMAEAPVRAPRACRRLSGTPHRAIRGARVRPRRQHRGTPHWVVIRPRSGGRISAGCAGGCKRAR
jgi:hypothetical protein